MKIDKQFILRNLITILCALCVIALFLSLVSMSVEIESSFIGSNSQITSVSGWAALSDYPLGWILLIGPGLLVAMNYIKQLEKFKGLLAILVPILCITMLFLTLFDAKAQISAANGTMDMIGDIANSAWDDYDYGYEMDFGAEADVSAGIGFYILLIANVGIIISGAVTYFGLRLNDLSSVKESGKAFLSTAREVTSVNREEPAYAPTTTYTPTTTYAPTTMPAAPAPKPRAPEHVVKPSAEEALQLIERLAKMRDNGILTDEEFQEKKKDLLKGV